LVRVTPGAKWALAAVDFSTFFKSTTGVSLDLISEYFDPAGLDAGLGFAVERLPVEL
jgi:hypothetical protein